MSGTYGEPGKNPYPIPGIVGQYSNVVNASTGVSQIYQKLINGILRIILPIFCIPIGRLFINDFTN